MDEEISINIAINGVDLSSMKVGQLKSLLEKRCIQTMGKKENFLKVQLERVLLQERVLQIDSQQPPVAIDSQQPQLNQPTQTQTQQPPIAPQLDSDSQQPRIVTTQSSGTPQAPQEEQPDDVYLRAHKVTQLMLSQLLAKKPESYKGFSCKPAGEDSRSEEQLSKDLEKLQQYHDESKLTPSGYCYRLCNKYKMPKVFTCYMCLAVYDSVTGFQKHVYGCKKNSYTPVPVEYLEVIPGTSVEKKERRKRANPDDQIPPGEVSKKYKHPDKAKGDYVHYRIGDKVDVILDDEVVGCGTVVQRTPIVHNNPLLTTEAKLLIDSLVNESQSHPTYSYDIQVGGYTAWPTTGLEHHEL